MPKFWACWLEHGPGVNNTKAMGLVPVWAIHLILGLDDPSGSFQLRLFHNFVIMCLKYQPYVAQQTHRQKADGLVWAIKSKPE